MRRIIIYLLLFSVSNIYSKSINLTFLDNGNPAADLKFKLHIFCDYNNKVYYYNKNIFVELDSKGSTVIDIENGFKECNISINNIIKGNNFKLYAPIIYQKFNGSKDIWLFKLTPNKQFVAKMNKRILEIQFFKTKDEFNSEYKFDFYSANYLLKEPKIRSEIKYFNPKKINDMWIIDLDNFPELRQYSNLLVINTFKQIDNTGIFIDEKMEKICKLEPFYFISGNAKGFNYNGDLITSNETIGDGVIVIPITKQNKECKVKNYLVISDERIKD